MRLIPVAMQRLTSASGAAHCCAGKTSLLVFADSVLSLLLPTAVIPSPPRTPPLGAAFSGPALAKHAVQLPPPGATTSRSTPAAAAVAAQSTCPTTWPSSSTWCAISRATPLSLSLSLSLSLRVSDSHRTRVNHRSLCSHAAKWLCWCSQAQQLTATTSTKRSLPAMLTLHARGAHLLPCQPRAILSRTQKGCLRRFSHVTRFSSSLSLRARARRGGRGERKWCRPSGVDIDFLCMPCK